jgi:hypothetical protein
LKGTATQFEFKKWWFGWKEQKGEQLMGFYFFLLHLGKHKILPKMPYYCGDRWVMGLVALRVSNQLAAFS